ncbi:MAG TPA: winged helix DNA-binding domain-containing protein [Vicinamibacteria bacterium]|nr:winged helix DNA-binding domain-containing protein [Vicinamibacteria bacterium]
MSFDPIRHRLVNQQLDRRRFSDPADLVRWMGAVQAQDYRGSLWAVGLRLDSAIQADVEKAIAARTIVRTWPMRGTLHFVPSDDVRWMLRWLTPREVARCAGYYRELGLDSASFTRSARVVSRALEGRALTRPELFAALRGGGIPTEGQRGIHIVGHLAQLGLICHGPRREGQPTFVLLDDWVPARKEPSREQALATLAQRYFASHAPATVHDFAWWSGLLMKDAREAVEVARSPRVKPPAAARRRKPAALLLPPWDEYIVAYKDREAVVGHLGKRGQERLKVVGSASIVIDGRVRGSWRRRIGTSSVKIAPEYWTAITAAERRAVRDAALRYAQFLGLDLDE